MRYYLDNTPVAHVSMTQQKFLSRPLRLPCGVNPNHLTSATTLEAYPEKAAHVNGIGN